MKPIAIKPAQVNRLQQLILKANMTRAAAIAAEQNMHTYALSIADAHGIKDYKQTELDPDKKTLTFIQDDK